MVKKCLNPSSIPYIQTWTYKVPIHCERCKKKVKKILQSFEDDNDIFHKLSLGVYKAEIDSKQRKVVVAGKVDAETLTRKLLNSRKLCELWTDKEGDKSENSVPLENQEDSKENKVQQKWGIKHGFGIDR